MPIYGIGSYYGEGFKGRGKDLRGQTPLFPPKRGKRMVAARPDHLPVVRRPADASMQGLHPSQL